MFVKPVRGLGAQNHGLEMCLCRIGLDLKASAHGFGGCKAADNPSGRVSLGDTPVRTDRAAGVRWVGGTIDALGFPLPKQNRTVPSRCGERGSDAILSRIRASLGARVSRRCAHAPARRAAQYGGITCPPRSLLGPVWGVDRPD